MHASMRNACVCYVHGVCVAFAPKVVVVGLGTSNVAGILTWQGSISADTLPAAAVVVLRFASPWRGEGARISSHKRVTCPVVYMNVMCETCMPLYGGTDRRGDVEWKIWNV